MMEDSSKVRKVVPSARRRLIRAAFAAPTVLALHSGSALAAASNIRCVVNANNNPYDPQSVADQLDAYVRVQLHRKVNAPDRWFLSGTSVNAFASGAVFNKFLPEGSWKKVIFDANMKPSLVDKVEPPKNVVLGPKWAALRFVANETGGTVEIVGILDGTGDGSALAGTCWTSFLGGHA